MYLHDAHKRFEKRGHLQIQYYTLELYAWYKILNIKVVLTVSTSGRFPGVWFLLVDVSEPSVRSTFKDLKLPKRRLM
jgi:hypothetical protein